MINEKNESQQYLTDIEIYEALKKGFDAQNFKDQKVLVLIPDMTRTAPVAALFRMINELLMNRVLKLDYMIALGTHKSLTPAEIESHLKISETERKSLYPNVTVFNHEWDKKESLVTLGNLSAEEIKQASNGLLNQEIPVQINKKLLDYDMVIICGPVFPHEVAGFSGGNKYLFPGVSGPEMIHFTHWLGALITSYEIIGTIQTPVRKLMDSAARLLPRKLIYCSVVNDKGGVYGLFIGEDTTSWQSAALLSSRVHIKYLDKPVKQVISVLPEMYDELWTGAKGMYKLEPVVADHGEIIIYAPHLTEISYTHGNTIKEIGYHIRDYFLQNWEQYKIYPLSVIAHSTHLKGQGTMHNGIEQPRISVKLASGISRADCEKINLEYVDPKSLRLEELRNQKSDDILLVENAGEILYRLKE